MIRVALMAGYLSWWAIPVMAAPTAIQNCLDSDPLQDFKTAAMLCSPDLDVSGLDPKTQADVAYRRGAAQYWNMDRPAARESLTKALELDPLHKKARLRRGWAHYYLGDPERAWDDFSELASQDENNGRAIYGLSMLLSDAGRKDQALVALRQAVQTEPDFYFGRFRLILAEYDIDRDAQKALQAYNDLLAIDEAKLNEVEYSFQTDFTGLPRFHDHLLMARRNLNFGIGRYEDALKDSEELAQRYPAHPTPVMFQSNDLKQLRRYAEALSFAEKAVGMCKSEWIFHACEQSVETNIEALYGLKRFKDVKDLAGRYLALDIGDNYRGAPLYFLGAALRNLGETEAAKSSLLEAASISDHYRNALITQIAQNGFYDGSSMDPLSERLVNGLEACMLDDMCMVDK